MAGTMNQETFKTLVSICKRFDPFPEYIDDYNQHLAAEASNDKLRGKFNEIMEEFGLKNWGVPCTNERPDELEEHLTQWLLAHDIIVEQKAKRVWTEEEIKFLVQNNDKVLYGALKNLYNCQTADEQSSAETTHANGAGFNALDAEFLTSCAKFLLERGFLTDRQKVIVRKKLVKYNKQLTRLANL